MKSASFRRLGITAMLGFALTATTAPALAQDPSAQPTMDGMASTAPAATTAADLRVTLSSLLGEHALLAIFATQKGFDGSADFEAAAAALDANTVQISDAIGLVFGDQVEGEFLPSWRSHIGFFVDYTVGLATRDRAKQDKAVTDLTSYIQAFGAYLASQAGLPADAVVAVLQDHVLQLKGQIDAYAAGDYATAYQMSRKAYAHMIMLGGTLADAIVARFPEMFAQ